MTPDDMAFMRDNGPRLWVVVEQHSDGTISVWGPFNGENQALEYEWDLSKEGCVRHWTAMLREP